MDVRVNRNHFGRQIESFQANLQLSFLSKIEKEPADPFKAVFIRAPIVEKLLPNIVGEQKGEAKFEDTVIAPSRTMAASISPVEIMGRLPGRAAALKDDSIKGKLDAEAGDIIAVRQANVFGTSFHPELTGDPRIHIWWLEQVADAVHYRRTVAI